MKQRIGIGSTSVLSMALVATATTLAGSVEITVPANTDATLDEAIAANYMTGAADYAGLLAADDLVVNGAGRLIIDKDLASAGYAGEVHVEAGSILRLTVSGALGDTAHGTFVADGATLETFTDGEANTLNFLGEPLSFAGTGVDGEGALVSLSTNHQRRASWGGTILTMTGDALVHVKYEGGYANMDFPYQYAEARNSLDMNGHTLTFCGPYSSGTDVRTLPIRLNITNPGHIVASNGLYVSVNSDNNFGGDSNNTFTIRSPNTRLDLYHATNEGGKKWKLIFAPEVRGNALLSTSGGGRWDGPIVWQNNTVSSLYIAGTTTSSSGCDITFAGPFTTDTGMEVTNTTAAANYNLYPKPQLLFTGHGNRIGGTLKASDMSVEFDETTPSIGGIEIVNTKVSIGGRHIISGLWKGTNQAYAGWSSGGSGNELLRNHFLNTTDTYTNSVAYCPDELMADTLANFKSRNTLVSYCGYIWNTNSSDKVITFFLNADCTKTFQSVYILNQTGNWLGGRQASGDTYKLVSIRLDPGPHPIAMRIACVNGRTAINTTHSQQYGIMYCWGDSGSTSTDENDYMPLMDPGDGSLFTRYAPGTDEYNALGIYGSEPFRLADSLAGSGGATLELGGGNYSVGGVTSVLTVINAALPHTQNTLFTVTDGLSCKAADLLTGEHLVVTGALKFAEGSTLSLSGAQAFPDYGTYVAAESTETISGVPTATSDRPSRLKVKAYVSPADGKKLMVDVAVKGTTIFFR